MNGDDRDILHEFITTRSEAAFAELVRRYVNLVHASALRQMKTTADAEDVTQNVFMLFAKHATRIRDSEAIGGWLMTATRYVALNALRADARRRRHEREAGQMIEQRATPASDAPQPQTLGPVLDEALARLGRKDRDAITLRYFQGQSVAAVATSMGITPAAAQKRLGRALLKMRGVFASRGIETSTDAMSAALLGAVAAPAAVPSALVEQITRGALSGAAKVGAGSSAGALKGGLLLMAGTKTNIAILAGVATFVLGLGGATAYYALRSTAQVNAAPTSAPAPAKVPASADPSATFNEIYSLQPGEFVKRISPPLPARDQEFQKTNPQNGRPGASVLYRWSGGKAELGGWGNKRQIAELIANLTDLYPQDIDMPRELLSIKLDGDWIYDESARPADRLTALISEAPDIFGAGMTFQQTQIERDVIVGRGQFKFTPLANATDQNRDALHVFRGETVDKTRYTAPGLPPEAFQWLGAMLARPLILEADIGQPQGSRSAYIRLEIAESAYFFDTPNTPDDQTVDAILANVAKQTNLQFTHERRMTTVWKLVKSTP